MNGGICVKYVILAAGIGTRLHPLTNKHPKSLYKLDSNTTVIERTVERILEDDKTAEIIIVVGFCEGKVREVLAHQKDIIYIYNPFYRITNSIASLWFAREYLNDDIVIINADIVFNKELSRDILIKKMKGAHVLLDTSIKQDGDYNVEVHNTEVTVMSKDLKNYYGEYAGITKLDAASASSLLHEIEYMVAEGDYDQWYENALVQMIFSRNFSLNYIDIVDYEWTEIDNVDDLLNFPSTN